MAEKTLGQYTGMPVTAYIRDPYVQKAIAAIAGGGGTWGSITGTIGDQTDLAAEFALKADAADVSNVDNTSDANKPVSTATQTALNLKADLASPALTGTPTAPTAAADTSTTQIATTAFAKAEADAALAAAVQLTPGGMQTGAPFISGNLTVGRGTNAIGKIESYSTATTGVNSYNNNFWAVGVVPQYGWSTGVYDIGLGQSSYKLNVCSNVFVGTLFQIDTLTTQVTIGSGTPHASAVLDVQSTVMGFLPPRMTTTERDAIATPAAGLQIFNTTDTKTQTWDGAAWQNHW